MPFSTYHSQLESKTNLRFIRQGEISLTGRNGLITKAAEKRGSLGTDETNERFTAKQLLEGMGNDHNRIISNVTPGRENELNLMSIEFISCYFYSDWIPLLFHMVQVAHDAKTDEENFLYENKETAFIRSFVYLRTNENGAWLWGRTGGVNGPLLWPSAMEFFQQEIESIGYKARI